jgi:acetyl esterase/lipase
MPIGYLIAVGIAAAGMLLALVPLRRSGRLGKLSWFVSAVPNESPFVAFYWVLAVTLLALAQGDLDTPAAWAGLGVVCVSFVGAPVLVRRSLLARPALEEALDADLGPSWRSRLERTDAAPSPLPWARILFAPLPFFQWNVKRIANLSYGDAGRHNRLDVYRRRSGAQRGPILIHLHAGYFVTGRKSFESRPLLLRLASHGWVCISANYRLRPAATFRDLVIDVKKVIAWARAHADEYGADPTFVFVAGSSAGAHLAATAALTANDPTFQPGFEDADTTVAAAAGFYGYYGLVDSAGSAIPSAPGSYAHPQAPPFLIAHGEQDTFVPPEQARQFVERLRRTSENPVVYVELPGGQHSFDLVHSIRFDTLIDRIEMFAAWVRSPVSAPEDSRTAFPRRD